MRYVISSCLLVFVLAGTASAEPPSDLAAARARLARLEAERQTNRREQEAQRDRLEALAARSTELDRTAQEHVQFLQAAEGFLRPLRELEQRRLAYELNRPRFTSPLQRLTSDYGSHQINTWRAQRRIRATLDARIAGEGLVVPWSETPLAYGSVDALERRIQIVKSVLQCQLAPQRRQAVARRDVYTAMLADLVARAPVLQTEIADARAAVDRLAAAPSPDVPPEVAPAYVSTEFLRSRAFAPLPEGRAEDERCTWAFSLRLRLRGEIAVDGLRLLAETKSRPDLQKPHHARGGRVWNRDNLTRTAGAVEVPTEFLLTVQKRDAWRGSWRGRFELVHDGGRTHAFEAVWYSPGRPPCRPVVEPRVAPTLRMDIDALRRQRFDRGALTPVRAGVRGLAPPALYVLDIALSGGGKRCLYARADAAGTVQFDARQVPLPLGAQTLTFTIRDHPEVAQETLDIVVTRPAPPDGTRARLAEYARALQAALAQVANARDPRARMEAYVGLGNRLVEHAVLFNRLHRYDQALEFAGRALAAFERVHPKHTGYRHGVPLALREIKTAAFARGDAARLRQHFDKLPSFGPFRDASDFWELAEQLLVLSVPDGEARDLYARGVVEYEKLRPGVSVLPPQRWRNLRSLLGL